MGVRGVGIQHLRDTRPDLRDEVRGEARARRIVSGDRRVRSGNGVSVHLSTGCRLPFADGDVRDAGGRGGIVWAGGRCLLCALLLWRGRCLRRSTCDWIVPGGKQGLQHGLIMSDACDRGTGLFPAQGARGRVRAQGVPGRPLWPRRQRRCVHAAAAHRRSVWIRPARADGRRISVMHRRMVRPPARRARGHVPPALSCRGSVRVGRRMPGLTRHFLRPGRLPGDRLPRVKSGGLAQRPTMSTWAGEVVSPSLAKRRA